MKCSEKNEFIKERWGGHTFKLWRGFRVPLLNIEGDPGSRVSKSRGPAPTFTPCRSLGTSGWCNFFSPKYFIGQQSRCLILKSRQRSAWKVSTGSSWPPEIVSKVCLTMRTLSNSFQSNRYFVGKNCWSKRNNR